MRQNILLLLWSIASVAVQAQSDTLVSQDLSEVVVTATRTEKTLSAIPMPVTLIKKTQIQQIGSLRLNEILQEQTGLAIVADHGQGIQMQGFNPEYTLILIDGEPLVGRTAGTLELSRLAVGNIKQIEIVKGPSSSLYGSEALAGVVNIITEQPANTTATLTARYGSNETSDLSTSFNVRRDRLGIYGFVNRYGSSGYDFTPATFGQTVEPFHNYTLQTKLNYDFTEKAKLTVSGRYFWEVQDNNFDVGEAQAPNLISGEGRIEDKNLQAIYDHQLTRAWRTELRTYYTAYDTESELFYQSDQSLYESTFFNQDFIRLENIHEYFLTDKHILTAGIGNIWESVAASRYEDLNRFQTQYAFFQYEWLPDEAWNIVAGGRVDRHSVYGTQVSPKLSLQYTFSEKLSLNASVGRGFKAPDFRQLYLNFTNTVAGYSVYGTEELPSILAELQAQNQIEEVLIDPSLIGDIQAETSTSYNFGARLNPLKRLRGDINFFRNDVTNLIESQTVAVRTNGNRIFSYQNLSSIFTQGIETNWTYQLSSTLQVSAGYQYLEAKDREVLDQIDEGALFRRDPATLQTVRVSRSEYGGLFGRSRHMGNFKIFYEHPEKGIFTNARVIYRGRYGFGDRNGNLVLDQDNEYVPGYATLHISAGKDLYQKRLRAQVGADNLLNYRDEANIPNLAGRLLWASIQFKIGNQP
ncbi:MAG: TonB-dependent receptor plug domain-containing protein [Thermonemataceae bacterium]